MTLLLIFTWMYEYLFLIIYDNIYNERTSYNIIHIYCVLLISIVAVEHNYWRPNVSVFFCPILQKINFAKLIVFLSFLTISFLLVFFFSVFFSFFFRSFVLYEKKRSDI